MQFLVTTKKGDGVSDRTVTNEGSALHAAKGPCDTARNMWSSRRSLEYSSSVGRYWWLMWPQIVKLELAGVDNFQVKRSLFYNGHREILDQLARIFSGKRLRLGPLVT